MVVWTSAVWKEVRLQRMAETSHTLQNPLMSPPHLIKPNWAVHALIHRSASVRMRQRIRTRWNESGADEPLRKSCSENMMENTDHTLSPTLCANINVCTEYAWTHRDGHVRLSWPLLPRHKQILNLHLSLQLWKTKETSWNKSLAFCANHFIRCVQYTKLEVHMAASFCFGHSGDVFVPLRSAALTSRSWAPWRATISAPSWLVSGLPVFTSLRASSKGTSSPGKARGGRTRAELPNRPWSLLAAGGTGLLNRASASIVELRKGLGSCKQVNKLDW